jgi:hypothetical protein
VTSRGVRSDGNRAIPVRVAAQTAAPMPTGFPTTRPRNTPNPTGEIAALTVEPPMETPAFAKTNTGTTKRLVHGWRSDSSRSASPIGIRNPTTTPATAGCTPPEWKIAMSSTAPMSSTIARVSRNDRTETGARDAASVSTPSASAMSVATGTPLTRSQPPGWTGYTRRVDGQMLAETAWPASGMPSAFVCGPTPFVEAVAAALVLLGYPATSVKTERFGPTGG